MSQLTKELVLRNVFISKDGNIFRISKKGNLKSINIIEDNYLQMELEGVKYYIHRIVWVYFNDIIPEGLTIDHINRIKSDNRIANLRLVTQSQNNRNKVDPINKTTGVIGVRLRKSTGKYESYVSIDNKYNHIATTNTLEEAVQSRMEWFQNHNLTQYLPQGNN